MTYAINRPADITPGPLSFSLEGLTFDVRTPRGHGARPLEAGRPSQRLQHPRGGRRPRPRSTCRSTRSSAASQSLDGVPGRFQVVSGAAGRSHGRRRLRAHRRRAAQPARDGAAARRRTPDHGVRLRRRSRSHQAPADGRRRRPSERSDRHHVGQPAQRGSERGSSRRCSAASRPTRVRDQRAARPLAIVDRREAIAKAIELARAGRCRADRRQGTREVSGDRRPRAAVRRRRGGARGAGTAAGEFRRRMTARPDGIAMRLTAAWVAAQMAGTLVVGDPSRRVRRCLDRHADAEGRRSVRRDSRRTVRRQRVRRRRDRVGARPASWCRADGGARRGACRSAATGRHRGRRHDRGAAGARARDPARVGHAGSSRLPAARARRRRRK